jgi:uncharacterized protein YdbL (DUF1318 family)
MNSALIFRILFLLASAAFGASVVRAEDLNAVKARMEQRLDRVVALKDKGVAGETNRGYLEARGAASADDQRVIAEENADRKAVYEAIAAKTNADAESVGRKRAQGMAAKPGWWVQEPGGEWRKR